MESRWRSKRSWIRMYRIAVVDVSDTSGELLIGPAAEEYEWSPDGQQLLLAHVTDVSPPGAESQTLNSTISAIDAGFETPEETLLEAASQRWLSRLAVVVIRMDGLLPRRGLTPHLDCCAELDGGADRCRGLGLGSPVTTLRESNRASHHRSSLCCPRDHHANRVQRDNCLALSAARHTVTEFDDDALAFPGDSDTEPDGRASSHGRHVAARRVLAGRVVGRRAGRCGMACRRHGARRVHVDVRRQPRAARL